MANEIEVRLVLDDGTYQKALLKVEKKSEKTGKKLGSNLEAGAARLGKALLRMGPLIAGVGAAFATAIGGRAALQAAIRQENAVEGLNQALRSAGTFSQEASQQIQAFAAEVERTTIVSDEAALEQVALARAFAGSNEQAVELTKAALELSAATGIQVESAVRNLGKSFSGLLGELGELLPATRNLTQEQLKSGEAVRFVLDRFGGSSAAQLRTFGGSIQFLTNTFGTLLESIGSLVTDSKAIRAVISFIAESFSRAASSVAKFGDSGATVDRLVLSLLDVAKVVTTFVLPPIELMVDAFQAAFRVIETGFKAVFAGIGRLASAATSLLGKDSQMARSAKELSDFLTQDFVDSANAASNSMAEIGTDFAFTSSVDDFITNMKLRAEAAVNTTEDMKSSVNNNFTAMAEKIKEKGAEIRQAMRATLAGGISRGIQQITNALIKGENVFEAFAGAVLSTFGDLAIQLGEFYIAQGIASLALKSIDPSGQIAAGAGLIALGTILKSFFGGGGASEPSQTASGGPVAGGGLSSPASDVLTEPEEVQARGPEISVNIQGNVLDRKETGLEIVEIINEAFETQGAVVRTA